MNAIRLKLEATKNKQTYNTYSTSFHIFYKYLPRSSTHCIYSSSFSHTLPTPHTRSLAHHPHHVHHETKKNYFSNTPETNKQTPPSWPPFDRSKAESRVLAERRCIHGELAYEKTTGYELIRANPKRLFSDRDGGIIRDCARECRSEADCKGFNMDYNRNECQKLNKNSDSNLFNLRTSPGMSFFEAICLRGKRGKRRRLMARETNADV